MGNVSIGMLAHLVLAAVFGTAGAVHAEQARGIMGVYPFADHGSMRYRTEPLLDFLRQHDVDLQLDVSNSFDELLQRGMRHEYTVLQAPAHFALYLQRCCGYRILAGWHGSISALWLVRSDAPSTETARPATLAVASLLSLSVMAFTGNCSSQFTVDERLHMLVPGGTHERALQALLRGKVDGAIVSGTALLALQPELRKRLRVVKEVSGLPGDVIVVAGGQPAPRWQVALERDFPDSALASEMQKRWHRPQGIVSVAKLQLKAVETHSASLGPCLRQAGALDAATSKRSPERR